MGQYARVEYMGWSGTGRLADLACNPLPPGVLPEGTLHNM